jgi:hypothetical protein
MNPKEFMGRFGLHSLSKQDPAYDENDVDHGGPGACIGLTAAVVERLYMGGKRKEATALLKRLLWLGDGLPYLGDSHRADVMDYRHDTPLQNYIQGAAIAQTMIFGLFGITVLPDRSVSICPNLPDDMDWMTLKHVRLLGLDFSISCKANKGTVVTWARHRKKAAFGETIILHA